MSRRWRMLVAVTTCALVCACAQGETGVRSRASVCRDSDSPPWERDLGTVTEEDLASARFSILFGGGDYGYCVLWAKPNAAGGYDVRVETARYGVGIEYTILEYRIPAAKAEGMRAVLAKIRLDELVEIDEMRHRTFDIGAHVNFIDLLDGRCVVFDAPLVLYEKRNEEPTPTGQCSRLIADTLAFGLYFADEDEMDGYAVSDVRRTSHVEERRTSVAGLGYLHLLRTPARPSVEKLAVTPSATLMLHDGPWTEEITSFFMARRSWYLATKGMKAALTHRDVNHKDMHRTIQRAMQWWARYRPPLGGGLDGYIADALQRVAEEQVPWAYQAVVDALHDDTENYRHRNMYRQSAPTYLAYFADEKREDVRRELLWALQHQDPYVGMSAARVLAKTGDKESAGQIYERGKKRDFTSDVTIPACALLLGERRAAETIAAAYKRSLEVKEEKGEEFDEYLRRSATRILGVPVLAQDIENRFADWPLDNEEAMRALAASRMRELRKVPAGVTVNPNCHLMNAAAAGAAFRGWLRGR